MRSINAISLTSSINNWLVNTRHPRVLHIFDRACNLINERNEVLSVVTREIGDGPFNLVLEEDVCFSAYLSLQSPITVCGNQLALGDLTINTDNAKLWSPRPNWEGLYARKDDIANQLTKLQITNYLKRDSFDTLLGDPSGLLNHGSLPITQSLVSNLSSALTTADISSALKITSQLAGLGVGLTPSGDDFIMGAIYAAWIIHPPETAIVLAQEIANTAAPLTTSLSAAWLRRAGKGEVGVLWHNFFDALIAKDTSMIQLRMTKLLAIGQTSGADALAGFLSVFMSYNGIQVVTT